MDETSAFRDSGCTISAADFVRTACDPARSVVVEACAGSGKTWLLVSRMLRLLLAGAEPGELLAITFTRKAAQEMRERLTGLLRELALEPDDARLAVMLTERGLSAHDAQAALPAARTLYARVLASPHGLSIDTFHSWFIRLLQMAPLASGVPHGYALEEHTAELRELAWLKFMQSLNRADQQPLREALMAVYQIAGDWSGREIIDAFISKRAEWQIMQSATDPAAALGELCGEDALRDARLAFWEDPALPARLRDAAIALGKGSATHRKLAAAIGEALDEGAGIEGFERLCQACLTKEGSPKSVRVTRELADKLGAEQAQALADAWPALAEALLVFRQRASEPLVRRLNEAMFKIGDACIAMYQAIKADRRKLDFADLELLAWRLLTDPEHAAYLHSRMDARYRHVLIDEFQDTNPLQWQIVRAWLDAYGDDGERPSVFIVGDPKQSIYRFRRAEPRVFDSARQLLRAHGAADLSTLQTRRNGPGIVAVLNRAMQDNPRYAAQSTLSADQHSMVWRLPLVGADAGETGAGDGDAEAASADRGPEAAGAADGAQAGDGAAMAPRSALRNPLREDPPEDEDSRREREARQVGEALHEARARWRGARPLKWSDMMILVRSRTHLRAYETGLRAAQVPFTSSRAGGLLDALEVSDLVALLRWMTMPADDLALAQVLKSPIAKLDDDELIALATDHDGSWWQRIERRIAAQQASAPLVRIAGHLEAWRQAARQLPVHDLLDLMLHEGGLLPAYAAATPVETRAQVLGNLEAFVALSLQLDAGRYPSIARFLEQLRRLQRGSEQEAPDEADVDAAVDAVRILTIHGAKGLEAEVVAIMDCNPGGSARDHAGVLCDWPQDADAPTHFSVFGRKAERGYARRHLFAQEEGFRDQEHWNLLYVAATRARHLLIVSGVASGRSGVVSDSWYQRLLFVDEHRPLPTQPDGAGAGERFTLEHFSPPRLPPPEQRVRDEDNEATREGTRLHALMERLTNTGQWPLAVPAAAVVARWLGCRYDEAVTACTQAQAILSSAGLARFFDPAQYQFARNEMEIVHEGTLLRMDRLVIIDGVLWILDYKRNLFEWQHEAYQRQLQDYRAACEALFPGKPVVTALITSDGQLWESGSEGLAPASGAAAAAWPDAQSRS